MEISKALLSVGKHILHLYGADTNKYAIQIPFLAQEKGKKIYITSNPETAAKELKEIRVKILVPEKFKMSKKNTRILVDASSPSYLRFEEKLQNLDCHILCTYDMTKLDSDTLKKLVELHDKLIITSGSATLLAGKELEEEKLDEKSVEKFVKNELPVIVLALTLNKPMCGYDIMKVLHKNFNVLISPGSLYPLLRDLEKKGLLKCEYGIKNKIYIVEKKDAVKSMLNSHIQTNHFISKFLEKSA